MAAQAAKAEDQRPRQERRQVGGTGGGLPSPPCGRQWSIYGLCLRWATGPMGPSRGGDAAVRDRTALDEPPAKGAMSMAATELHAVVSSDTDGGRDRLLR